jgi:hypothetical protein
MLPLVVVVVVEEPLEAVEVRAVFRQTTLVHFPHPFPSPLNQTQLPRHFRLERITLLLAEVG